MSSPEQSPGIDVSHATLWNTFPLGETLTQFTHLEPPDQQTQETLDNLHKYSTHGPVLVPIYHSTRGDLAPLDMVYAARFLTHNLDLKFFIASGAVGDLRHPLIKILISPFTNQPGIHLFPVARDHRELKNPKPRDLPIFLIHSLFNRKVAFYQNLSYIKTAMAAVKDSWPHTMIFSATYEPAKDDSDDKSMKVYEGMKKLLTLGPHICYCVSLFNPEDKQYYTFLSEETTRFSRQSTDDEIDQTVNQAHQKLLAHAQDRIPALDPDSSLKKGDYLKKLISLTTASSQPPSRL